MFEIKLCKKEIRVWRIKRDSNRELKLRVWLGWKLSPIYCCAWWAVVSRRGFFPLLSPHLTISLNLNLWWTSEGSSCTQPEDRKHRKCHFLWNWLSFDLKNHIELMWRWMLMVINRLCGTGFIFTLREKKKNQTGQWLTLSSLFLNFIWILSLPNSSFFGLFLLFVWTFPGHVSHPAQCHVVWNTFGKLIIQGATVDTHIKLYYFMLNAKAGQNSLYIYIYKTCL